MNSCVPRLRAALLLGLSALVASCGGGNDSAQAVARAQAASRAQAQSVVGGAKAAAMTQADAERFAQQATFGPTEAMIVAIQSQGAAQWLAAQMQLTGAQYTSGGDNTIDVGRNGTTFCNRPPHDQDPNCYVQYFSSTPLKQDFYRNATTLDDQVHQRVALALQHIFVISDVAIQGTYGMRNYYNTMLGSALGNYRDVLRHVALSPVMGDYLNNVNNNVSAPNENFSREQLQLFSTGPCLLNLDGSLKGGSCTPVYDNDMVREYAYSLTGWTYPVGGSAARPCPPLGANCQFYDGDMVVIPAWHDPNPHTLLTGVKVPANSTAPEALEKVLDSIMAHANVGPFVGYRMIQDFVSSNPSPQYVTRVAQAFNQGKYASSDGVKFGNGKKGDMKATIAAVLLDDEARSTTVVRSQGFLRDPIMFFTGVLRGLNGRSDGSNMGLWGGMLAEDVFRPPSVFDFYPPNYPVAGTALVGPQFGIHNANGALNRLNFLNYLLYDGGTPPTVGDPNSLGTVIDDSAFLATASDAGALVDRLSLLAFGHALPAATRTPVVNAVSYWTDTTAPNGAWTHKRVSTAAYLVYASPDYAVQR